MAFSSQLHTYDMLGSGLVSVYQSIYTVNIQARATIDPPGHFTGGPIVVRFLDTDAHFMFKL